MAWYDKGETGEYLLDQVESLLDGMITVPEFVARCKRAGLSEEEVDELLWEEGAVG
jgi:hypothetical protein